LITTAVVRNSQLLPQPVVRNDRKYNLDHYCRCEEQSTILMAQRLR
jgi:hypothetical protein